MNKKNALQPHAKLSRQLSFVLMIVTVALAMLVPLLSSRSTDLGLQDLGKRYVPGELAEEDVFATDTFQFIDEQETNILVVEAQEKVLPQFSFSLRETSMNALRIQTFISLMVEKDEQKLSSFFGDEKLYDDSNVLGRFAAMDEASRKFHLQVLEETTEMLLSRGLYDEQQREEIKAQGYDAYLLKTDAAQNTPQEKRLDDILTNDNIQQVLSPWFEGYEKSFIAFQPQLVLDALSLLVKPNVLYEQAATLALRQEAALSVEPVAILIERGSLVIEKDTVVTEKQLLILQKMGNDSFQYTILELLGRSVFILLATTVSIFVFIQLHHSDKRLHLYLNLMFASLIFSLLAMLLVSHLLQKHSNILLDSSLPVLFAPLFTSHITSKKRLGLVTAFLFSCYATLMPQSSSMTFFFSLTCAGICLYFFRYTIRRLDDLFNWLYASVSCSFAALTFNVLVGIPLNSVLPLVGSMLINITITLVLVEALVPLCEKLFNIPTAYRLSELAFSESPVLDRLSTVAQGTYNHSRYVSDLAYQAARFIGANALLAKVGGIYHDIGKSDHPEYFIENQGMENKHDDIKPSLSVAIIKSHVRLGLEKGREAGLPQEVLDIIAQHHGNDVIQFFYNEAKNQAQEAGIEVKIDDYSYTGNPPTFPESAIVMLADCVEAASRTLKKPTHSKYQKLVHTIIMGKIERGQLKDSQLSLTDLDHIEESFIQTLTGRDHHRIEYPDESKDEQTRGKGITD